VRGYPSPGHFAERAAVRALCGVSTNSQFKKGFLLVFPRVLWWWWMGLDGGSATWYHEGWSIQGSNTAELEPTNTDIGVY
jgi:hypothetical protein